MRNNFFIDFFNGHVSNTGYVINWQLHTRLEIGSCKKEVTCHHHQVAPRDLLSSDFFSVYMFHEDVKQVSILKM